jgi:hypothetical protein
MNYKYYDLYTINESINKISYKFNFSLIMKNIHDVFHVFFLKHANEKNDETSFFIWIKNEKQWKIEKIVDKIIKKNRMSYLIKWLEYSHSNNEWMKKKDMSNVKKTIKKFFKSSTKNDKCVNRRRRWDEKSSMHSFQIFSYEIFLSLILTRHRKNKKKIFNFSIYLKNYLLLRDKTRKRFLDENENLHLKLLACCDLFDDNIIIFFFFIFFFFFFFLVLHLHLLSFSLSFLERVRAQHVLRANTIRSVDALFFFDERAKIDRDVETKTFEKTNRDIINTFINVSFRRSLRNVDLWN